MNLESSRKGRINGWRGARGGGWRWFEDGEKTRRERHIRCIHPTHSAGYAQIGDLNPFSGWRPSEGWGGFPNHKVTNQSIIIRIWPCADIGTIRAGHRDERAGSCPGHGGDISGRLLSRRRGPGWSEPEQAGKSKHQENPESFFYPGVHTSQLVREISVNGSGACPIGQNDYNRNLWTDAYSTEILLQTTLPGH